MATYKGSESLSREETIEAWKAIEIEKKSIVAVCLRMHCGSSTLYRAFRRWGLPCIRRKRKNKPFYSHLKTFKGSLNRSYTLVSLEIITAYTDPIRERKRHQNA